ncbi:efflux RND transporter periplasmic adaptor subunit [bacterium]|nr:efflux RND transporter periplasmic adaptor subunit [bacterium]
MNPQNKRIMLILIVVVVAVSAIWYGLFGRSSQSSTSEAKQPKPLPVEVQEVRYGSISHTLELSGEVVAIESAVIAATKEGPITNCPRREGDVVQAGEKLVEIDRAIYRAEVQMSEATLAVAQAKLADLKAGARPEEIDKAEANVQRWQATLEEARKNHERETELFARKFTSQQSVDQARERMVVAEAELAAARETLRILKVGPTLSEIEIQSSMVKEASAKLELAKTHLAELIITAPFDGIITKVHVRYGDLVSARAPLIEMYAPESLVLRFAVPEAHVAAVKPGLKLKASFDAIPGKIFAAEVELVYPQLDEVMRTRTIEARLTESAELLPNMFTRLTLELQKAENAALVPANAVLTTTKGVNVVFIADQGKAQQCEVELGIRQENVVQIIKGIEPGDKVIVAGNAKLRDGQAIKIIGKDGDKSSSTPKDKSMKPAASQSSADEVAGE